MVTNISSVLLKYTIHFLLFGATLIFTLPSYADWSGKYSRSHTITMANADKQYLIEEAEDTLSIQKSRSNTWLFELYAIARSANMCDITGEAKQINKNFLEYKQDDCTLQFQKKGNDIHVKDVGRQCQNGCGMGVYLDGLELSPKSKKLSKPRQATPLKPISNKKLKSFGVEWKEEIKESYIHRSKKFHKLDVDKLTWHSSKWEDNKYFLFAADLPYFIILNRYDKKHWRLVNIWEITYPKGKIRDDQTWKIYPALYPISDWQNAVAITTTINDSYSGGGAGFDLATVIPLESSESTIDFSQAIIPVMPFSCSSLIRAVFSGEEYDKYGDDRYHDKRSAYLALKTLRSNSTKEYDKYKWRLTWYEEYLAGASFNPLKKTKQRIVVDLNKKASSSCETFNTFNFCGDGVENHCLRVEEQIKASDE